MNRSGILRPGVYELEGGVPLGPAVPPGYVGPPPPAPQVQIIEPTAGWWRNAGAFGQRFTGRPSDREGEIIPLFEQPNLPGPPKPWWLHWYRFDRTLVDEIKSIGNWEFRGRIIYGVGGIQNIIETDVMQGLQYPIVCNSISVQLKTYAQIGSSPFSVAADCKVTAGCMLGAGAGSANVPPTYTTPFFEVQPAVDLDVTFPIPDFARSLVIHTDQTVQAGLEDVSLIFNAGAGAIKEVVLFDLYDVLTQEKGIAIPGGANQVTLHAETATNVSRLFGIQFFLAL